MPDRRVLDAAATPLASIFGSGFLVIVPILHGAVGPWSVAAMAGVCILAYAVGSVIRFNIRYAEPLLESGSAPKAAVGLERISDFALILAYAISVCLYINILSAFLLGGLGLDTPLHEHLVTVTLIAGIGLTGYLRGLDMLQFLERWALCVTLLIIVALLVGFAAFDWRAFAAQGLIWPELPSESSWTALTVLAGTLIVVQGFETSRYLGAEFDTETRVRSCRLSQIISSGVYLLFVAVATPLMHFLGDEVKDNALIMLAGKASVLLPLPLVVAAVMSQFSAAVADTIGGGGSASETTHGHIDDQHAYLLICGLAMALAFAPTLTILALASRAFAFYYMLQCLVAISVSQSPLQKAAMGTLAGGLACVAIFAVPAG